MPEGIPISNRQEMSRVRALTCTRCLPIRGFLQVAHLWSCEKCRKDLLLVQNPDRTKRLGASHRDHRIVAEIALDCVTSSA